MHHAGQEIDSLKIEESAEVIDSTDIEVSEETAMFPSSDALPSQEFSKSKGKTWFEKVMSNREEKRRREMELAENENLSSVSSLKIEEDNSMQYSKIPTDKETEMKIDINPELSDEVVVENVESTKGSSTISFQSLSQSKRLESRREILQRESLANFYPTNDLSVTAEEVNPSSVNASPKSISIREDEPPKHAEIPNSKKIFIKNSNSKSNLIYHLIVFSDLWFLLALCCHNGQFICLLTMARFVLSRQVLVILAIIFTTVTLLLLAARYFVEKHKRIDRYKDTFTPEDETDRVPPISIYCLIIASLLEGIGFAVYGIATSNNSGSTFDLSSNFYSQIASLEVLGFASITLLCFHRILRPANRIDPLRTFMELEVVSVCWDALDGSTVCQLIDSVVFSRSELASAQFLVVFWYLSVGIRMAIMIAFLLPPDSIIYKRISYQPLQFDEEPTIDRTMQGLRIRTTLIGIMACAELFAAGFRIMLWSQGMITIEFDHYYKVISKL